MTRIASKLPPGLTCYRRTPELTRNTVPEALLAAHKVKAGVWGLLRVLHGHVRYCLDDKAPESALIGPGGTAVIEPRMPHHVELLDADSTFLIEFHRGRTSQ